MSLKHFSKEQLKELSLIEMAYETMKDSKKAASFHDILKEVSGVAGLTEKQVKERIAQFYTDINVDGRFLSLGDNRWGLRIWYPIDTQEEEVVTVIKPKKKKAKKVVEEDFDDVEDEDYDELDVFADEDDLLDDDDDEDDDLLDDIDEVDEFDDDDEDVIEDEEEIPLGEVELDEELDEEDESEAEDDKL